LYAGQPEKLNLFYENKLEVKISYNRRMNWMNKANLALRK